MLPERAQKCKHFIGIITYAAVLIRCGRPGFVLRFGDYDRRRSGVFWGATVSDINRRVTNLWRMQEQAKMGKRHCLYTHLLLCNSTYWADFSSPIPVVSMLVVTARGFFNSLWAVMDE